VRRFDLFAARVFNGEIVHVGNCRNSNQSSLGAGQPNAPTGPDADRRARHGPDGTRAIVDLLLLGMYADRHIAVSEQEFLATEMAKMGWDEFHSPEIYLQRAVPLVREVLAYGDRTQRFLQTIAQRLPEAAVMKFAIEQFSALIALDGVTAESEASLFDQVMETFFAMA
jgi:hypothetical protein